jgi:superfamily I DNA/RNA helicase
MVFTPYNQIIFTVTEMANEHGVMTGTSGGGLNLEDLKEEEVLKKKRMEAKQIYEKFHNRLSGQQMLSGTQIISTSHGITGRNFFDVFLPFYLLFGF